MAIDDGAAPRHDRFLNVARWLGEDEHRHGIEKMHVTARLILSFWLIIAWVNLANAGVVAKVHLFDQSITVFVNGQAHHFWRISSGREGYETPRGEFRPEHIHKSYFSRKYNRAPMPHSVFFYHGYAIHGTTAVALLGRPASRGCIRLHPNAAKMFFALILQYGLDNTRIVVTD